MHHHGVAGDTILGDVVLIITTVRRRIVPTERRHLITVQPRR